MSALLRPAPAAAPAVDAARRLVPMSAGDLDAVMAIETGVYSFPWTRGNFIDSLAAGYDARLLRVGDEAPLLGYFVAMAGAAEMHLLNITVAPGSQRRGHARFMLAALALRCAEAGADRLWLEVRDSNAAARAAYRRLGFVEMGVRPGYYPAAHGRRESAVVMSLDIEPRRGAADALE
jgi:ribosomal-protein-alanine N-acetyltransferase